MRSEHELDFYFKSKRFKRRLDHIRKLGEGYEVAGAIYIVDKFRLMQNHYGIISHYLKTGNYDPSKENEHQIEIVIENETVKLVLPPNIRQRDIISFLKSNSNKIKESLRIAYKDYGGHKSTFHPEYSIERHLAIVDELDKSGKITPEILEELSEKYKVDISDIRKINERLGAHNNPFIRPVN